MGNVDFIIPGLSVAVVHLPVMSEENTAHAGVRVTLDAVKKESILPKWAAVKGTVLKAHFTEQRTILGVIPFTKEQVRNVFNKVPAEKEVLNKDEVSYGW